MLRVKHREDHFLQECAAIVQTQQATGGYSQSGVGAIYAALLDFVDKRLVGSPFVDRVSLELALSEWPAYAFNQGIHHLDIWEDFMYLDGEIRTRRIDRGGPFVCAMVEEVKDDEDFSDLPPKARALFLRARELGVNSDDIEIVLARIKKTEQPNPDQQSELKTDWAEVVALNPRGYLEMHNGDTVMQGPIASIEMDPPDHVLITLQWQAWRYYDGGDWIAPVSFHPVRFQNFTLPFTIEEVAGQGRCVRFGVHSLFVDTFEGMIDMTKVKKLTRG